MNAPESASIVLVRGHVAAHLQPRESSALRASVIVLAVDGVPFELSRRVWRQARVRRMSSVFPTTSSCAWLSSLTGQDVPAHGIPGVVFKLPDRDGSLIDVFDHAWSERGREGGSLFGDASAAGYLTIACGDFSGDSAYWTRVALADATVLQVERYFGAGHEPYEPDSPSAVIGRIQRSLLGALECARAAGKPAFIWCFIEIDRHVHRYGYDSPVEETLTRIDDLASSLASDGLTVLAYSDHGLTRTSVDGALEELIRGLTHRFGVQMGGAGRTRWLYLQSAEDRMPVWDELARGVGESVALGWSHEHFPRGSVAERRVGEIVLVARGESFLGFDGLPFDHGSLLPCETEIPFAIWPGGGR